MTMVNEFYANGLTRGDLKMLMLMLSPFAPHMVEEMWELTGEAAKTGTMAMQQPWPEYDESKTVASTRRDGGAGARQAARHDQRPGGQRAGRRRRGGAQAGEGRPLSEGKQIVKVIHVKNKLVNLIIAEMIQRVFLRFWQKNS